MAIPRISVAVAAPIVEARVRSYATAASAAEHAADRERASAEVERLRIEPLAAALASAAQRLDARAAALEVETAPQLIALVKAIAAEVLRREIEEGRYDLAAVVRECLAVARGVERGVKVALHPADFDAAESAGVLRETQRVHAELRADPTVERGACHVETAYGHVVRDPASAVADVFAALDGRR